MSLQALFTFAQRKYQVLTSAVTWNLTNGDSSYPPNLVSDFDGENLTKPSKSTALGDSWVATFGSAVTIAAIALWHNADVGNVIRIQANSSNSWGAPPLDVEVTAPPKHRKGFSRKLFIDLKNVAGAGAYQYWRIVIPANDTEVAAIKALLYTDYEQLEGDVLLGTVKNPRRQMATLHATEFDVWWRYNMGGVGQVLIANALPNAADLALLLDWFEDNGNTEITTIALNPTDPTTCIIGFLLDTPSENPRPGGSPSMQVFNPTLHAGGQDINSVTFGIVEATAGLPEWT